MKNFYKDINVFSDQTIKRYASGFPIDTFGKEKRISLNGEWKFRFIKGSDNIPEGYERPGEILSDFDTISVPSNWQILGYDIPIYTNINYPYALESKNPFTIPKIKDKFNTVGLYVKEFSLSNLDENVFISFGGINSAAEIYVNGEYVGYSEDSFDPQEYDITNFVIEGVNKLAVTVYRFCTGSYLEDQDMWRLSGIFRDVDLIFKPRLELSDIYAYSELDGGYKNALLKVKVEVSAKHADEGEATLEVKLLDGETTVVSSFVIVPALKTGESETVDFSELVKNVNLWSNEIPYLYDLVITLYNGEKERDKRIIKFGFRNIEIAGVKNGRGPFFLLNGKPVKFRGVNRHEFHPEFGHAVPAEYNEKDIKLLLQNNVTAIRNCHYPNSRGFYELCDRLGVLVIAECNLETHGLATRIPKNNKKWSKNCVYRMENMVNTLKNHPCIIMWSLGNESGYGKSFDDMREACLKIDDTRPIHYEPDQSQKTSDVLSEMYAKLEKMPLIGENKPIVHCRALWNPLGTRLKPEQYKDRPFIECEYAHSMGNSLGNFSDYWDMFKKYDRLSGGFIWDFADQSIKRTINGITEWTYGGDFNDKPNDGNFAFNGIFRGDRSPNPALYEVKYQHQMIEIFYEKGKLIFENLFSYINLDTFKLTTEILIEGKIAKTEVFDMPSIIPGEKGEVKIDFAPDMTLETSIIAYLSYKEDTLFAKSGHVAAYKQFVFEKSITPVTLKGGAEIESVDREKAVIVAADTKISINMKSGGISAIERGGVNLIVSEIKPLFWRATIDNDRLAVIKFDFLKKLIGIYKFKNTANKIKPKKIEIHKTDDGLIRIDIKWKAPYISLLKTAYLIGYNGEIELNMVVRSPFNLIRYAFTMELKEGIENVSFYGKGPFENYCDRATAAILKTYEGKAEDFIHDYLYPQENGNHIGVRWLKVGENEGIKINAIDKPFEMSVHPYTIRMLDNALHLHELNRLSSLTVNIDGKQRGVGGDIPAIACTKPKYKNLPFTDHTLKVTLTPFFKNK